MSTPYPFDPTGALPANKIINEPRTVTVSNGVNAFLIVPDATPFYGTSLTLVNSAGQALIENTDYYLTHPWKHAEDATGLKVYGSITLLTGYAVDNYNLNYQTIGGEAVTARANAIQEGLIAYSSEYITLDWSTVPAVFPPTPHTEPISNLTGMTDILDGLQNIALALESPARGVHFDDIADMNTAYAMTTTKPMVELIANINSSNDTLASFILFLADSLKPFLNLANIDPNLQNYTIPIGPYQIKIGYFVFQYATEPAQFTLPDPEFTSQCLFAHANISFFNTGVTPNTDSISLGRPVITPGSPVTIPFKIFYDPAHTTGARIVNYIAIGI